MALMMAMMTGPTTLCLRAAKKKKKEKEKEVNDRPRIMTKGFAS